MNDTTGWEEVKKAKELMDAAPIPDHWPKHVWIDGELITFEKPTEPMKHTGTAIKERVALAEGKQCGFVSTVKIKRAK